MITVKLNNKNLQNAYSFLRKNQLKLSYVLLIEVKGKANGAPPAVLAGSSGFDSHPEFLCVIDENSRVV